MTVEEAKKLCKGDYVVFNNEKYKVANVKELRSASSNEPYVQIKCYKGSHILWAPNNWIEPYLEEL